MCGGRAQVSEKEAGILGALRTVGVWESAFWLSHFLTYAPVLIVAFTIMYFVSLAFGFYFVVQVRWEEGCRVYLEI